MFYLKITVWNSTNTTLTPDKEKSKSLSPTSFQYVPLDGAPLQIYLLLQWRQLFNFTQKKALKWKRRRGYGEGKVIEETSIWLWHLHIGEITGVATDCRWGWNCSCQYVSNIHWLGHMQGVFLVFFLTWDCPHVRLEQCIHAAHLHCLTLVQYSVFGLGGVMLLSRYTVKLMIIQQQD